jgi:carbon-monoxide dehydrogenase large subunit
VSELATPGLIGARVHRVEDAAHLHGRAAFVADLALPGMLEVAFVRSVHARASVRSVPAPDGAAPGRFWTAADLPELRPIQAVSALPGYAAHAQPVMASTEVRFVGEILGAALAASRYDAEDLADQVGVDAEPLPPVVTVADALRADAPLANRDVARNLFLRRVVEVGDLEASRRAADLVYQEHFANARYTGVPLETRGVLASYDPDRGELTVWSSTQVPHLLRTGLAAVLGLPERRLRVIAPDVGGGFGVKCNLYPEDAIVAALAMRLGRPVRWIEDRREHLLASLHAREHEYQVEAHVARDGEFLGLRVQVAVNVGAYGAWPWTAAMEANMSLGILPGPYRIRTYHAEALSVCTNTAPSGPYRGVGRPGACFAIERTMDEVAHRLGLSPVEIRRRNLIRDGEFPYTSVTGLVYDSGSFQESLRVAAERIGYPPAAEQLEAAEAAGRHLGVGFANYTEQTAHGTPEWVKRGLPIVFGYESAQLTIDPSGEVTAAVGTSSQGQGHETSLAQLIAGTLGLELGRVTVRHGDTALSPYGMGTFASRSAVMAGGAVIRAAHELRDKLLQIAAQELETPADQLEIVAGVIGPRGQEQPTTTVGEIAQLAYLRPERLPPGLDPGLTAVVSNELEPGSGTFANSCHAALVEVDPATGEVRLLDYVVVEDCGRMINPMIVDGQVHGGVAQGIGGAIFEEIAYSPDGQILTSTLMDYLLPGAPDVPAIRVYHLETPGSDTPLGMKGMGEGGAIAPPAAVANAVAAALRPLGVRITRTPLKPSAVWDAIQAARRTPGEP